MKDALRYSLGTALLLFAVAALQGAFGMLPVYGVAAVAWAVLGYANIYKAVGPVDWNVMLDGLLED